MEKPEFGFVLDYVSDMETAKQFYVEVLGLRVERSHPTFVQFAGFAIATDESMTEDRAQEIYWIVSDAEAAFSELSQRAAVSMPIKLLPFGKVFGVKDPDGHHRYLLEWAKVRPSKPE